MTTSNNVFVFDEDFSQIESDFAGSDFLGTQSTMSERLPRQQVSFVDDVVIEARKKENLTRGSGAIYDAPVANRSRAMSSERASTEEDDEAALMSLYNYNSRMSIVSTDATTVTNMEMSRRSPENNFSSKVDNAIDNDDEEEVWDVCEVSSQSTAEPGVKFFDQEEHLAFLNSLPIAEAVPDIEHKAELVTTEEVETISKPVCSAAYDVVANGQEEGNSLPSISSVKVFKKNRSDKLGIRFQESPLGFLTIAYVSKSGKLAKTSVRVGQRLLRIDNQTCDKSWTTTKAVTYLKQCKGFVSIITKNDDGDLSIAQADVQKSNPVEKLGIALFNDPVNHRLRIRSVNATGLLGNQSALQVGDYVETINHIPCAEVDSTLALSIIRNSEMQVTIRVRNANVTPPVRSVHKDLPSKNEMKLYPVDAEASDSSSLPMVMVPTTNEPSADISGCTVATEILEVQGGSAVTGSEQAIVPGFISVTLYKPRQGCKLGISFAKIDGILRITRLSQTGLLKDSPLKAGLRLMSINGKKCYNTEPRFALQRLREATGLIHLIAHNPSGSQEYVQAMVCKLQGTVGVSFKGSTGRQLKICDIRKTGLFVHSALNVGDSVISINDIACHNRRPRDAVEIVRNAGESVTILARHQASNGVVVSRNTKLVTK